MIRFDAAGSFGTPSYYVQQMMANNIGTRVVPVTVSGNVLAPTIGHKMGFSTWGTKAEFRNLKIDPLPDSPQGGEWSLFADESFSTDNGNTPSREMGSRARFEAVWTLVGGATSTDNSNKTPTLGGEGKGTDLVLRQQNQRAEGSVLLSTTQLGDDYTIRVQARRLEGNEGFIIVFGAEDEKNLIWWNLGGWGNTQHAIEHMADGGKNTLAAAPGHLEEGRWYDVEIQVKGTSARCLLDGQLIHEFSLPERQSLYANATLDEHTNELFVKLVNPTSVAQPARINLGKAAKGNGQATILASEKGSDENTMRARQYVAPVQRPLRIQPGATHIDYPIPPFSLSILRLQLQ